jgi:hypothetical protein
VKKTEEEEETRLCWIGRTNVKVEVPPDSVICFVELFRRRLRRLYLNWPNSGECFHLVLSTNTIQIDTPANFLVFSFALEPIQLVRCALRSHLISLHSRVSYRIKVINQDHSIYWQLTAIKVQFGS